VPFLVGEIFITNIIIGPTIGGKSHMSPRQNKLFSLLPIPFFVGLPGFRSKLWMVNEATSDCQRKYLESQLA
jgi:hypothetical protein